MACSVAGLSELDPGMATEFSDEVRLNGSWLCAGMGEHNFVSNADGRVHARVIYREKCWIAYTMHTEGNGGFATREKAMRHAERQLRRLVWEMRGLT